MSSNSPGDPSVNGDGTPVAVRRGNGLGVASLIVGIIGLVLCCIPFAAYGGLVLVVIGLILGIIGLIMKHRAKGTAIAGTIISGVGLIIGIVMAIVTAGIVAGLGAAVTNLNEQLNAEHTVVYEVTGTVGTASVSFNVPDGDSSVSESNTETPIPFTKTFTSTGAFNLYSVSASAMVDGAELVCKITVDGVVVKEDRASGSVQLVTCIGS